MHVMLSCTTCSPRLPKYFRRAFSTPGVHLLVGHVRVLRVRRQPQERPEQHDALHAHLQVGLAGHLAGDADHVAVVHAGLLLADRLAVLRRHPLPHLVRVGVRRLHEDRPARHQALERQRAEDGRRVVDAQQLDVLQLRVHVDVRLGDGQVVGRRQALLLGAVLRVRLHVLAEHVAGDGRDDLVGRHASRSRRPSGRASRSRRVGRRSGSSPRFSASGWSMPTQK